MKVCATCTQIGASLSMAKHINSFHFLRFNFIFIFRFNKIFAVDSTYIGGMAQNAKNAREFLVHICTYIALSKF